jgi:hypothetical protein
MSRTCNGTREGGEILAAGLTCPVGTKVEFTLTSDSTGRHAHPLSATPPGGAAAACQHIPGLEQLDRPGYFRNLWNAVTGANEKLPHEYPLGGGGPGRFQNTGNGGMA